MVFLLKCAPIEVWNSMSSLYTSVLVMELLNLQVSCRQQDLIGGRMYWFCDLKELFSFH